MKMSYYYHYQMQVYLLVDDNYMNKNIYFINHICVDFMFNQILTMNCITN